MSRVIEGEKRTVIADALGVHLRTIDFHLQNVRRKLGVTSIVTLAVRAVRLNGALH